MSAYTVKCSSCGHEWMQGVVGTTAFGMHPCPKCGYTTTYEDHVTVSPQMPTPQPKEGEQP